MAPAKSAVPYSRLAAHFSSVAVAGRPGSWPDRIVYRIDGKLTDEAGGDREE